MYRCAYRFSILLAAAWSACHTVPAASAPARSDEINAIIGTKSQRVRLNLAREFLGNRNKFTELLAADGGVDAFNTLREVDDTLRLNLLKVNLNGFDLKKINWELAKIYWSKIRAADLSGANLRGA